GSGLSTASEAKSDTSRWQHHRANLTPSPTPNTMHLSRFGLVALGAAAVNAFRDTSPFFLASTSEVLTNSAYIQTGASLLENLSSSLSTCPSDYYVVVYQPGVHSSDYSTRKSAPRLGAKMLGKDSAIRSKMSINEVAGLVEPKEIKSLLEKKCKAQTTAVDASSGSYPSSFEKGPRIIDVEFPMLSLDSDRAQQLSAFDGFLADVVDRLPSSSKYTILYITSPREFPETDSVIYEASGDSYQDSLHMELKRDYSAHGSASSSSNHTSLFEEYQYFTPGIFMGLMAAFLFFAILYIGISALSSLEIPYAAFEKDTSAAVQKKAQ
ncbi:BIG/ATPase V1 complex subunit S1, partial [Penicillium vulpinum]